MQLEYTDAPAVGVPGAIAESGPKETKSRSASTTVYPGLYVRLADDEECVHPQAEPAVEERGGIALRNAYQQNDGVYAAGDMVSILTEGFVWVQTEAGSPGVENQPVYVRVTASGAEKYGAMRADDNSGDAVIIPGLYFRTSGPICKVELRPSSYVEPAAS